MTNPHDKKVVLDFAWNARREPPPDHGDQTSRSSCPMPFSSAR